MKVAVIISMFSIVVLLSACIKDTSGSQPLLVQSITIDSNACVINYTYDALNRLTSITQCDTTETFTYTHDSVIDIKISSGVLSYQNIYLLNTAGLATGYTAVGASGPLASYVLTYDANGHLLSSTDTTHPNTANIYTVQNSDVVLLQSTSSVTGMSYSISTTFYNNTINRLGNANYGLTFLGTSSANLKKSDTYTGLYTVNYTYQLNSNNGIYHQVSTINGVIVDSRYYSYY